ncbi:MAG: chromate transporter [Candidatus Omnitrophica bacterium CG_4_10_14_0_8_um_filter_43_18]|nr:MAG: chromate transporter [Candidatus Omnitrophica bacterium CG02_land_8_20_14_3_00__42_8]PIY84700.1 MAG: chromate transporter [Candidatus Omnitrophica bacterium CG_4_10_14_0_8_um_filter_43_18]
MILIKLFITFLKVGLFTIGSGYSMLVLAQRYVVDTYHWLTLQEFTDLVAISEITPGPIMINLATFVGTKTAGLKGAIFATLGLVAIPFIALYVIALNYTQFKDYPVIQNLLKVIRPMAIGFITVAILKLFKTSITDLQTALIAIIVIVLTVVFKVNPIFTVVGGIVLGLLVKL